MYKLTKNPNLCGDIFILTFIYIIYLKDINTSPWNMNYTAYNVNSPVTAGTLTHKYNSSPRQCSSALLQWFW